MKIEAWPFLVSRNSYLDYRVVVAPEFLNQQGSSNFLARITEGNETTPNTVIYREIYNFPDRDLAIIFRILKVSKIELWNDSVDEVLRDPFGREIYFIEGIVICKPATPVFPPYDSLSKIHPFALDAYRRFWPLTDSAPPESSSSLEVIVNHELPHDLSFNVLPPYEYNSKKKIQLLACNRLDFQSSHNTGYAISSIALSPIKDSLVIRNDNQQVLRWHFTQTDQEPEVLLPNQEGAEFHSPVVFNSSGDKVFVSAHNKKGNSVLCIELDTKSKTYFPAARWFEPDLQPGTLAAVALSPNGHWLAAGSREGQITLWDLEHDSRREIITRKGSSINALIFDHKGQTLISGDQSGKIQLWNTTDSIKLPPLQNNTAITSLSLSHNGEILVFSTRGSVDYSSSFIVYNFSQMEELFHYELDSEINCIKFLSNSQYIALGCIDSTIRFINLDSQKETFRIKAHESSVTSIDFNAAKGILASSGSDGVAKIWRIL